MRRIISRSLKVMVLAIMVAFSGSIMAAVGDTTRVSVSSTSTEGNFTSFSYGHSISADGRYTVFYSGASNLVAGDTNNRNDIFVHDRNTGNTTRVSVDSAGVESNHNSINPSISADGRYIAYHSFARNLVAGDTNNNSDVFVHDRNLGSTTRVSVNSAGVEANGDSRNATISADGRYIAYSSTAVNLVAGDTNNNSDVFVHDRNSGNTTRVSVSSAAIEGDNASFLVGGSVLSADGRYVVFYSFAANLVVGDTNGVYDVFVHDRNSGDTTRVSVSSVGVETDEDSLSAVISADGRYVAFSSDATNLVVGDTNAVEDVFVHDRNTGATTRVSVSSAGIEGNNYSFGASISADGRYIAFYAEATNLVVGDTNGAADVFVHDRNTNTNITKRVSVSSAGIEGDNGSYDPSISANGAFVLFSSDATNLVVGDTNGQLDVFVHENAVIVNSEQIPSLSFYGLLLLVGLLLMVAVRERKHQ